MKFFRTSDVSVI